MEQAPLISIIMPVYNAGVLLHTAVESVLRQSFADFELLLVDDGSTDGSAALAHELAKKDGRIRVLEQPNAGICAARNLGLQHCRGQWFTFCDDDDTMLPAAGQCCRNGCGAAPPAGAGNNHSQAGGAGLPAIFAAKRAAVCLERYVLYKSAGPSAL